MAVSKSRVFELAKEFNVDGKKILEILRDKGFKASNNFSAVDDCGYEIIKQFFYPETSVVDVTKINSIVIHNFRDFYHETKIEIHPMLTLIVGQNGTSKSTLLGMLCQPFEFKAKYKKYTNIYDCIEKVKTKTISGENFESNFSNVFRMSNVFDNPSIRKYNYTVELSSPERRWLLSVSSELRRDQKDNMIRFVTGRNKSAGEGNYPHPVIYLGLNRLYPLANSQNLDKDDSFDLSKEEREFYSYWQKEITVVHDNIAPEYISSDMKSFLACQTYKYDAEANSAGQDNLGQIISAIISFYRLKNILKEKYRGGVLLIDEVDATLHVLAQENLMKFLVKMATELSLQVICTTHSLTLIELCSHELKKDTSIVSLFRRGNYIYAASDANYENIVIELSAKRKKMEPPRKTILFEDSVAADFFKSITNNTYNSLVKIYSDENKNDETCLPADVFLRLSAKKIPDFRNIIFIIDGDKKTEIKQKHHNIIALPGNFAIEVLMYAFLYNLSEDDGFWSNEIGGYNFQICFNNYMNLLDQQSMISKNKIEAFKAWFRGQEGNWGEGNKKLYKRWIQSNKDLVLDFNKGFFNLYNKTSQIKLGEEFLNSICQWVDKL